MHGVHGYDDDDDDDDDEDGDDDGDYDDEDGGDDDDDDEDGDDDDDDDGGEDDDDDVGFSDDDLDSNDDKFTHASVESMASLYPGVSMMVSLSFTPYSSISRYLFSILIVLVRWSAATM